MGDIDVELAAVAKHLSNRREAILQAWQSAIKRDPTLTTGDSLPRVQLYDHIPAMLLTFERELYRSPADAVEAGKEAGQAPAAAHGLQRWRQGYDLREVTRELGKLNECVVAELDSYTEANPDVSHATIAAARRLWAALCSTGIEESVGQYFELQQEEAAGHVKDLESALAEIQAVEQQRADLWRQAAHDLRGNLGVVANATVGLTHNGLRDSSRDEFVRILMRNVTSLHHLLDDVTEPRTPAGRPGTSPHRAARRNADDAATMRRHSSPGAAAPAFSALRRSARICRRRRCRQDSAHRPELDPQCGEVHARGRHHRELGRQRRARSQALGACAFRTPDRDFIRVPASPWRARSKAARRIPPFRIGAIDGTCAGCAMGRAQRWGMMRAPRRRGAKRGRVLACRSSNDCATCWTRRSK